MPAKGSRIPIGIRLRRYIREAENGCWEWVGGMHYKGYGLIGIYNLEGKMITQKAHRVAYEEWVGPIPDGLHIDHLCRNRRCVNPGHLEPVTARENSLRGISPSAVHAKKTHCPQGHAYEGDNVMRFPGTGNHRFCRACHTERNAKISADRKAKKELTQETKE